MNGLFVLFAVIAFSTGASYFLKLGVVSINGNLNLSGILSNWLIWIGSLCYASAFIGYILLLRTMPLSLAQPAITAGVSIITALLAIYFLKEQMALINWVGLSMVCTGVFFLFVGRT